jgi:protein TonB
MNSKLLLTLFAFVALLSHSTVHAQVQEQLKETNVGLRTVTSDEINKQDEEQIYVAVEQMPEFIGGQAKLMEYINHEIHYPINSKEKGIQGTVYVGFVVSATGKITHVKLLRGIKNADDLNAEALRVMSNMPDWKPGKQNGKNVSVQFTFPIKFAQ